MLYVWIGGGEVEFRTTFSPRSTKEGCAPPGAMVHCQATRVAFAGENEPDPSSTGTVLYAVPLNVTKVVTTPIAVGGMKIRLKSFWRSVKRSIFTNCVTGSEKLGL